MLLEFSLRITLFLLVFIVFALHNALGEKLNIIHLSLEGKAFVSSRKGSYDQGCNSIHSSLFDECFKLPISLCKEIEAMISKFWRGQGDSKKIHWMKWSSLCSSKSIDGMGFRDIQKFNNALWTKQVWRLIHQKDTLLYKVFNAKHFPHGSIMDTSAPQKCSYAWRSILQAREVIEKCAIWRVGSEHGIDVWKHRWLPNPTYNKIVSPRRESSVS